MGGGWSDIFSINNNTSLCIVNYYSKFPIMKKVDGLSSKDLIVAAKNVFSRVWTTKGNNFRCEQNFISDKFTQFLQTTECRAGYNFIIPLPE